MSLFDDVEPVDDKITSINVLLYGRPGVGKTYFAGQGLDHGKRNLILSFPGENIGSAARGGGQTNVAKITSWEQLEGYLNDIEDRPDYFDWIIVDSLTSLQLWVQATLQKMVSEQHEQASTYQTNNSNPRRFVRTQQLRYEDQERLRYIVDRLVGSDANVLFLAHEMEIWNPQGTAELGPMIEGGRGKLAALICSRMQIVLHLTIQGSVKIREKEYKNLHRFDAATQEGKLTRDNVGVFKKPYYTYNLTLGKFTQMLLDASEATIDNPVATKKEEA